MSLIEWIDRCLKGDTWLGVYYIGLLLVAICFYVSSTRRMYWLGVVAVLLLMCLSFLAILVPGEGL